MKRKLFFELRGILKEHFNLFIEYICFYNLQLENVPNIKYRYDSIEIIIKNLDYSGGKAYKK